MITETETGDWASLGWGALTTVIDNELKDEYMPNPYSTDSKDRQYVLTDPNGGGLKEAGTGAQLINGVSNNLLIGAGVVVGAGLFIYLVTR